MLAIERSHRYEATDGIWLVAALACTLAFGGAALAQGPTQERDRANPQLPPGVFVTPPRQVPLELLPDGFRGDDVPRSDGAPAGRRQPHGGCRYDEQKLDLLV